MGTALSIIKTRLAPYRLPLALAAAVALSAFSLYVGYQWGSKSLPEAVITQQKAEMKTQTKQAEVTAKSTVEYVDRIITVREKGQTIVKEVVKYVPNDCVLPDSVRVFHDAAAKGAFPGTAGTDDAPGKAAHDAAG